MNNSLKKNLTKIGKKNVKLLRRNKKTQYNRKSKSLNKIMRS